jgi:hypothetical protein
MPVSLAIHGSASETLGATYAIRTLSAAKLRPHINAKIIEASAAHIVTGCFMTFCPCTPDQPRIILFFSPPRLLLRSPRIVKQKNAVIQRNGYCSHNKPEILETQDSRLRASRRDTSVTSK